MHVELFAASDAGRDAVRQILPDLRRDLGQQGVQTSLDLSGQNQPAPDRDPGTLRLPQATRGTQTDGLEARPASVAHTPVRPTAGSGRLDVLA